MRLSKLNTIIEGFLIAGTLKLCSLKFLYEDKALFVGLNYTRFLGVLTLRVLKVQNNLPLILNEQYEL